MIEEKMILADAIRQYGVMPQIFMAFEEMAELQKELCKNVRGRANEEAIAEEIADVEIMLTQIKMIYSIENRVCGYREKKILRLRERLESDERESADDEQRG